MLCIQSRIIFKVATSEDGALHCVILLRSKLYLGLPLVKAQAHLCAHASDEDLPSVSYEPALLRAVDPQRK